LLFVTFLISIPVAAQQPQRDPQAVTVLQLALATMGGSGSSIQDSVADGVIAYADGRSGTIRMLTKGSDRLRHEVTLEAGQETLVVNAGRGYGIHGGHNRNLPPWMTMYQKPEHVPTLSRLTDFMRSNMRVIYVGLENVAGHQAHHILFSALPTGHVPAHIAEIISEFHMFLDVQSALLVKTRSFDFSPEVIQNRSVVETYYSDYRPVNGTLIPHAISRFVAGQRYLAIALTAIHFNVGLSDTEFQLP
jgi:hypothetical protein